MNKQKGFTLKELVILMIIIAVLGLIIAPRAEAEFSVAGGVDFAHDAGDPYAEVRYFGESWRWWNAYAGTNDTLGAEVYYTYEDFEFGIGIEYAKPHADVVDTKGGYSLRAGYNINKNWSVEYKHRSNCKTLCDNIALDWLPHGDYESTNHGYNAMIVRLRFN